MFRSCATTATELPSSVSKSRVRPGIPIACFASELATYTHFLLDMFRMSVLLFRHSFFTSSFLSFSLTEPVRMSLSQCCQLKEEVVIMFITCSFENTHTAKLYRSAETTNSSHTCATRLLLLIKPFVCLCRIDCLTAYMSNFIHSTFNNTIL